MSEGLVDKAFEILEDVQDPELGVDIVNLGLVYEIYIDDHDVANIKMTMTSMGCPVAGQIVHNVKTTLKAGMPHLKEVHVDVVWNPPWSKDKMSRIAKIALGVHG
ncbi:metal-sulfur cluster assembly factor [Evansella cellulosilytica]|uniref:MIP18 family-like domain-containing protein n=1 Tax=Evansella cellulosilytica (strain ATCC 21833 / DSM 2522 / FERM P-1141 / JCM 9156 / N-4) TaxID=649639 RepID=E6TQP9_EVAC2|nr:metal-sulfur cluster assembly factor [Evansella cellulosilytica]ADU30560.1 protein of unknown function DUF59 [Evansella cellulosilytica DSM 2522]